MSTEEEKAIHCCGGEHTLSNFARWQKVSRQTVYRWCKDGMPHNKNTYNRIWIPCQQASAWIKGHEESVLQ